MKKVLCVGHIHPSQGKHRMHEMEYEIGGVPWWVGEMKPGLTPEDILEEAE